MKNYLNKLGLLVLLVSLASCNLFELDDFLVDPNNVAPENAETSLVMNRAMFDFARFVDETSDQSMPYVRMVAMADGTLYETQDSPASFDFTWTLGYAELLPDLELVIEQSDAGGFNTVAGAARVMEAYVLYTLVDMFGDVPFSEALMGIDNPSPRADDDATVYAAATAILDEAIANLSSPSGTFGNDLFYGGSASAWLKAATTLKLRMLVQTKLAGGTGAAVTTLVNSGNLIDEVSEDFQWKYGTNLADPDSRHPYFSDSYGNGANGYMSNYYMWLMFGEKPVTDPRLRYYFYRQDCDETNEDAFTLDCVIAPYPAHWTNGYPFCTASGTFGDPTDRFSGYWGRDHGNADGIPPDDAKRTVWGLYPAGGKFDADDCNDVGNNGADGARGAGIQPILLSSLTHFLLAEAALTMDGFDGDPLALMLEGINQSFEKVTSFESSQVSADFAATADAQEAYIATVSNLYNAATTDSDRLDVIIKEMFLSIPGMGMDAYNAYRRTGKPARMQRTEEPSEGPFPRSFWYPANYVNRNQNASQKPNLTGQVFWDTNPATGFIN